MEVMLRDAKVVESRVVSTLKSQETRIEGLNKDLENRGVLVLELEQEKSKRKEQVMRMKSLIQPLRDEFMRQKSVNEENNEAMSKKVEEMGAMK